MAILVNLHVVAGADPCTVFNLFIFVWIKPARAQRPTNLVYVLCEAEYHLFSNTFDRRYGGAGFLAIFLDKDAHPLYRFFARVVRHCFYPVQHKGRLIYYFGVGFSSLS